MNIIQDIKETIEEIGGHEKPQRLLLELSETEIRMKIYHQGELSSRTLQLEADLDQDGLEAYFNELSRVLGSESLWKLEKQAELVFLLPDDWCYIDKFELPKMDKRELLRTLEWELEQSVPWPRNNYYYDTYKAEEKHTYVAAATTAILIDGLLRVGSDLDIAVKEITTGISVDAYLAGKPHPNLLPAKYKRELRYPKDKRVARLILGVAVVLSVSLVFGAFSWRKLAEDGVFNLQVRLKQLAVWEEQVDWSQSAQKRIDHLQRTLTQLNKEKRSWQPHLELWSDSAGQNCWLESVATDKSDEELVLRGKALDVFAVAQFVKKLKMSGYYKDVELSEFATEDDGRTSFVVHLHLKDDKK